jgi:hypothetical protein
MVKHLALLLLCATRRDDLLMPRIGTPHLYFSPDDSHA